MKTMVGKIARLFLTFGWLYLDSISGGRAASLIWGVPTIIAGNTDVATNGTFKYAYDLSGAATTINGVTFTGSTSVTGLGSDVTISGVPSGQNYTSFNAASGTFTNLSAAYQTLLRGGDYDGSSPIALTLKNLTVGKVYLTQIWVNDSRSNFNNRYESVASAGGNSVILSYNNSTNAITIGGVGQYVVGTFTANAPTMAFKLTGNASSQFNAIQVRDLGAEARISGSWNTTVSGQAWGMAGNWTNNLIATGTGSTADFGQSNIPDDITVNLDTPRVIGNCIFGNLNSAVAGGWYLANNGVSGNILTLAGAMPMVAVNTLSIGKSATIYATIAGVAGLTKAGPGQLTLAGVNTYNGTTTIMGGTLALSGVGSITGSSNIVLSAGATLDVSGVAGGYFALAGGQTLTGSGTVNGALGVPPGGNLYPGGTAAGILVFNNNLDLSWGSTCYFDLSTNAATGNDQIVVGGHLTLGGTVRLKKIPGGTPGLDTSSDYALFAVGSGISGNAPGLVWDGATPTNADSFALNVSGSQVLLHYSSPNLASAPTNVFATLATNGVSLTWNVVPTATGYNVKRATVNGGPYARVAAGLLATNYYDANTVTGQTYYYVVSAVNSFGEGNNSAQAYALPATFLKANGCDLCDHAGTGKVVSLRGSNLGGWLFFEGWMCPNVMGANGNALEQDVAADFTGHFGIATNDSLMNLWRDSWITTNDLDVLVSLGMNLARFHFTYDTFQEVPADSTVALANVSWKPDAVAFKYMDWLMTECAQRQLYVVLDYDYPEGNPTTAGAYQDRFIYIWQRIAAHYAGNATVLGYDLWNEAYTSGVPALFNQTYQAIRQLDPDHPIIMEQCWWGPNGDLSQISQAVTNYNWKNIIGEQHYVDGVTISNLVMAMRSAPPGTPVYPVYCGECMLNGTNVGLPDIKAFAGSGALFTSWTLKSINQQDWSLLNMINNGPASNSNCVPDLLNDSASAIAGKWAKWRTPSVRQVKFYQPSLVRLAGPVCVDDALAVGTNGMLAFTASMLLTNDTDLNPSNQLVIANLVTGRTAYGTISTNANGYLYQADAGFMGVDSFTYQDLDQRLGLLSVNTGKVTLSVGVPPAPTAMVAQGGFGVVTLSWGSSPGATSYNLKRAMVSGGSYTTIAAGITNRSYNDTNVFPCEIYYYVVTALAPGYESPNSSEATAQPARSIPPQYQTADIGSVGLIGSAAFCEGQFTISGSGGDIWGSADAFRFVYAPLTGNGAIVARVANVTGTDPWAKAGVMMRETLTAGSRNVYQLISYSSDASFQWRSSTGGSSSSAGQSGIAPAWVMLTRTNNTFTGYVSADGIYWTQVGTTNISMAAGIYAGFAVTAHNNSSLNTSVLDSVSASFITNLPPAVSWVVPTNNSVLIQPRTITLTALASDPDGTITNVVFFNGSSPIGMGIGGAGNSYSLTWSNVLPGSYPLAAVATDNLGATNISPTAKITVLPLTVSIVSGWPTNGPVRVNFAGQDGQAYVVEVSTNLTLWLPLTTNMPINGVVTVTDTNWASANRFYRIRQ